MMIIRSAWQRAELPHQIRQGSRLVPMLLVFLLVQSCASQAPTRYYNLRVAPTLASERELPASTSLGIGPVTIPSELDRPGLVTESGAGVIAVADYHIWAGEFGENLSRVMAGLMAGQLNIDQVYAAPWDTRFRPYYQMRVDVQRFSGELGGEAVLEVMWTLTANSGRQKLHTQRSTLQVTTADNSYQAYVNAMSDLLRDLSAVAANRLEGIVAEQTGTQPSRAP